MNPIEMMREIERTSTKAARYEDGGVVTVLTEEWRSLRAAIEAQAEELAQAKKGWETTSEYAKGCGETIAMLQEELAQARARIAVLMEIGHAAWHLLDSTGHDMSKDIYEVPAQDVAALEKALDLTGHFDFHDYMQEHPAQSAAALKADALRDFAGRMDAMAVKDAYWPNKMAIAGAAREEANRIEREAKEES